MKKKIKLITCTIGLEIIFILLILNRTFVLLDEKLNSQND